VVGANTPVQLYEILDFAESAPPETTELAKRFNRAMELFDNRDWTAAEAAFKQVLHHDPGDNPARIFRSRCAAFREKPPEADWDGVINLSEK
jgi:adenylate cyclase